MAGLTLLQVVSELSELQGKGVLFLVRGPSGLPVFEGIDAIDRVFTSEGLTYIVFRDMEASAILRPGDFVEAQWEGGWRRGQEDNRVLRIQLGQTALGFSPL